MGDRMALPGQHQERRLEGVLGVVVIPQDPTADAPDHRAVTTDQGLERRLFSMGCEPLQEPPVRKSSERPHAEERLEFPAGNLHAAGLPVLARSTDIVGLYLLTTRSSPVSYAFPGSGMKTTLSLL